MAHAGGEARARKEGIGLWRLLSSRTTFLILGANLFALGIVFAGVFTFDDYRDGLIEAKSQAARLEAELLARTLALALIPDDATPPALDAQSSREFNRYLGRIEDGRTRIFSVPPGWETPRDIDLDEILLADTQLIFETVAEDTLPPVGDEPLVDRIGFQFTDIFRSVEIWLDRDLRREARAARLEDEIFRALGGDTAAQVRVNENGRLIVSVSAPVRRVQAVQGVVTVELGGVEELVKQARGAVTPVFLAALLAQVVVALFLTAFLALPMRRLALAADQVRADVAGSDRTVIPDYPRRSDEIGHLSGALIAMTGALYERIRAIEAFAADVAHELKNPLTSIRSASETLGIVKTQEAKDKLVGVIQHDVERMDRLITDISNASRLDADLAREERERVNLSALLADIIGVYEATSREGAAPVTLQAGEAPVFVEGFSAPLGQVFRNLIDNARSFSPEGAKVHVLLEDPGPRLTRIAVEDDGPGVPEELREKIFNRFYTERPQHAAKGNNSGLGLAICRQIAAAHGGTVRVESAEEAGGGRTGARFVVEIPRAR